MEHYVSPAILAEVHDVLSRTQIRTEFRQLTDDVVAEFIARIERIPVRVDEVSADITLARDPKDEPYLNLTAHSRADYVVSRDRDLLESGDAVAKTALRLRIVDPAAFLDAVREQIGDNS